MVLLTAAAVGWWSLRKSEPFPLPPLTPSPFLNTKPDAVYVGSAACVSCHQGEHDSYRHTGMGASMAVADPRQAPPDGAFEHALSHRRYQVVHKDGALWHRELLRTDGPTEVVLAEYPVQYVVGSGRHALTYLTEVDGFLVESPITWYASRRAWGISPGYDEARQQGFARPIGEACLYCHASQATALDHTTHRMQLGELAIGCERCHGPGSLHVEHQRDGGSQGAIDHTIVNPRHLSRDLAEAICQQCHLNSDATAIMRGRQQADFRPGLPLSDFRQVYVFADTERSMTVVGHVEQMHRSRCYQGSREFSCLTCHDPHGEPAPAERRDHDKAVCLTCHQPAQCTVPPAVRQRESPANDCIQCHMPRSATDIPHLAFTHHRVGVHRPAALGEPAGLQGIELRPFLDQPQWGEVDRRRALGEGYRQMSLRDRDPEARAAARSRAYDILTGVHVAEMRDGNLEAALAQLSFDLKAGDALGHAERALADPELTGQARCDALFVSAQERAARGDQAGAVAALLELTQLRRYAFDWLYLANYTRALGDEDTALAALEAAVRIDPRQSAVHRHLAERYRQLGDPVKAEWHRVRAVP
jgi:predicted CXXCH cytochrome family protein